MLKLGIADAWFTALVSAEMFALEEELDVAELLGDVAELCEEELELELELVDDEHAASRIAAPTAVSP